MKAILCKELSGYENLTLEDVPSPQCGQQDLLVDVKITALNFFDTLITQGKYQDKPELPFSPGGEISGVISENSPEHPDFKPGDRVLAYLGSGGLREQIAINPAHLTKIPSDVSDETAASLMITYGTAMHGLVDRGNLHKGQVIAILGAGGGAGLAAVEIATALDATVIAVASSKEKLELTQRHGAKILINSTEENLKNALKAQQQGRGIDMVYDCVGGDLAEPALRALAWNGRYLVVGFAAGKIPAIPFNIIMLKGIHVQGVFWGRFIKEQPDDFRAHTAQLLTWAREGVINPHIHAVFPLEETKSALALLANRKAQGKVLIRVS